MLSFKTFIAEKKELPFDKAPKIGFWKDHDHVTVYHGTHDRHADHILKHGLTHKDPKTGMISVTHDPHTAHGYAAMSSAGGEAHFRSAGAKVTTTPHEDRSVIKMKIPREWAEKHMDHDLSGNVGETRDRMKHKEKYDKWKKDNPNSHDHEYYQTSELRFNKEVPHHFIQGVMKKKPKVKA